MNSRDLLYAMTNIENVYILSAQRKLGYDAPAETETAVPSRGHRTLRRALALIAAVIVVMSVCFTTALAVSPEFRELVFRFLHIEQAQVIPETPVSTQLSVDDMFVEQKITIGDVVEGKYVHTPVSTNARNGIYLVCTDEVEMRQGSHYDGYYEENGAFVKLEEHSFCQDYTLYGSGIHVEFDWVEHGGSVAMTWVDPDVDFGTYNQAGDSSAILIRLLLTWTEEAGATGWTWYPVLLDLNTGVLTDVLAGTGAERLDHLDQCAISEDHTRMLLGQDREEGYFLYYADLAARRLYSVDELSGAHADACSLIGSTLACWNQTEGYFTAWKIDLNTLERTELFDSVYNAVSPSQTDPGIVFLDGFDGMNRWGNMYAGCRFALEVDEARTVSVIDLVSGVKTPIEGYTWRSNTQRTASPDGKKLLLAGGEAGQDFAYVGVLDYERMTFVEFSRENTNEVYEYLAYWFDPNTIIICSEATSGSLCNDYYLYSLLDETE